MIDNRFSDRLCELAASAEKGIMKTTGFLTPEEQYTAVRILRGYDCGVYIYGGCAGTERNRVFLLPEYFTGGETGQLFDMPIDAEDEIKAAIKAVKIIGSGYEKLEHRSFMGALLNLGLQRSAVGDIALIDSASAYVFCSPEIADFLCGDEKPLISVGRDKVKAEYAFIADDYVIKREFQHINDTVASDRLDCVVGALCDVSREKAKEAIERSDVTLNYETTLKCDTEVGEGDVLSVRGFGKFIIRTFNGRTRKDRLRLSADKYI